MLAPMSDNPASWHPDPMGRHQLRYWDGKAWTDHVSDNGVQARDPLKAKGSATPAVDSERSWVSFIRSF